MSKKYGVVSLKVNYYENDQLILADLQTEILKKLSTRTKFYMEPISKMLGSSPERLAEKIDKQ